MRQDQNGVTKTVTARTAAMLKIVHTSNAERGIPFFREQLLEITDHPLRQSVLRS